MSSTNAFPAFLEKAALYLNDVRPLLPMYLHLVVSALFPIYTGAHASLSRPSSAAKPKKKAKKSRLEDDDDEEDKIQKMEGLSNKDAIMIPVTAAATLATLYYLIKKYGADFINLVMGYYFAGIGIFSVAQLVNDAMNVLVGFLFPTYFRRKSSLVSVSGPERKDTPQGRSTSATETSDLILPSPLLSSHLPQWLIRRAWDLRQALKQKYTVKAFVHQIFDMDVNVTIVNLFSGLAGLATAIYVNTVSKPWYLTNLQGFAVSYSALQLLSPTTFATGSLILGALFFYDIWAVFFTPLMVAVAKNLDQPIKLVFPRPDEPAATPDEPPLKSYSMLGLGDIVVPGIMIGLALRFDLYMHYLKKQTMSASKTTKASSTTHNPSKAAIQKAPYVSVTGRWGDRFWTWGLPTSALPPQLKNSFPKPYFTASIIGYVVGMLTTLGVMSVFQHAQPALLYLVPGVLLSLWLTALVRGEIREMWYFSEAVNAEQVEEVTREGGSRGGGSASNAIVQEQSPKGLFERLWTELWHGDETAQSEQPSEAETASPSKRSNGVDEGKGGGESKGGSQDGLLASFSISRYMPKAIDTPAIRRSDSKSGNRSNSKSLPTTPGTKTTADAIVVMHTDSTAAEEEDSTPRYRTRSVRRTLSKG